jgi:hypothetical protein
MDSLPIMSALFYNNNQNQKQTTMPNLQSSKLKWMDLEPNERYRIVGQVIDGMIYHSICLDEVKEMLSNWNDEGFLKSIILPDEPDNMCSSCNGTGQGSTPDNDCWKCRGNGSIIHKTYDYEG